MYPCISIKRLPVHGFEGGESIKGVEMTHSVFDTLLTLEYPLLFDILWTHELTQFVFSVQVSKAVYRGRMRTTLMQCAIGDSNGNKNV